MRKPELTVNNLQTLLFNRTQIISLLDDTEVWGQIPLEERFALVDSSEFVALMGDSFAEHTREMLETELLAQYSTHH